MTKTRLITLLFTLALVLTLGACKKKPAPPPVAPPPPPPAPTATLTANPDAVERGQATQLSWRTENATDVTLEGVGKVQPSGSEQVTPNASTTYRLIARGPGGEQEATARVTVAEPAPAQQQEAPVSLTDEQAFAQNVKDVFFDYDSYDIRADAQQVIAGAAQFLKSKPHLRFTIEGHADERGSTEYNLALGDNRARAVRDALVAAGVEAGRINVISFGKEKPFCTEANEQCWQQNRRGHFVLRK